MDYNVCKVQIAGAGAGKTYSMAEEILKYQETANILKDIIAITYTNSARDNIRNNIIKQNQLIPKNVIINTIHSFLLEYIIYPYSNYILNKKIYMATSISLPTEYIYKNKRMSELEQKGIVHNEKVFNLAKQIVVPNSRDTKKIKTEKANILEHIKSNISAIFIDESQDLSNDVIEIVKYFGKNGIFIFMIGDTKQALKYPKIYKNFVSDVKANNVENFMCIDNNNITRRLPKNVTKLSNFICSEDQKQKTLNKADGELLYTYSDNMNFDKIYRSFQNSNSICYIKKKSVLFNTQEKNKKIDSIILKEKLLFPNNGDDKDAFIYEKTKELYKNINTCKDTNKGLKIFLKNNNIYLTKSEYAKLINSLEIEELSKFNVYSLDKVKGLEKENCMFILDTSLFEHLIGIKKEKNKENNYLYVGLTRTTYKLLLVIDCTEIKKYDRNFIDTKMREFNIEKIS